MKFTEEQFDEILGYDKYLYLDDLPFEELEDKGLKLFNSLPDELQGLAVQWGTSDTVFRDDLFEFLIENQFGMTVKAYYASGILDKYWETKVPIPIDYDFLKMSRKERLQAQLKSKHTNVSFENKEKRVAFDETFGQDKMDLAKKVIGDKSAELLVKLTNAANEKQEFIKHFDNGGNIDNIKPLKDRKVVIPHPVKVSNQGVLLFEKDYNGFESWFDIDRDMSELLTFENQKKIPSEFSGTIRVLIEYYPSDNDLEEIKNL